MNKKNRYLGKWELGCLVFHACFYKIFTSYPQQFGEISGSAAWITVLYTGIIFLAVFGVVLWILQKYKPWNYPVARGIGRVLLAGYWIFSAVYALGEFTEILQEVAYPRSPQWLLAGFFLLGAVVTVLCGGKAVYRMHSLTVLGIGLAMAAVAVFGLKYAEPAYLAPWLGKGPERIFGTGLSALFLYTDSLLVVQLIPRCRPEVKAGRVSFLGASLAVLVHTALMLVSSMSHPLEVNILSGNLLYPLTKAAYFGKFWSRLDMVYMIALITSGFLHLSMALHLFFLAVGKKRLRVGTLKTGVTVLGLCLCLSLSGCYDGREVEESAYAVGLGVDKGEEEKYCYTFQLSNPLELGGTIKTESMESSKEGEEEAGEENKTVSNIRIEAENFYLAVNRLKSHLSKEPDFSHLKVIVFSGEVAREGLLEHTSLLFQEREIRPSTNVCLAESAQDFLIQVKPTLEQSTARYYELFFQNRNTPYAPVVELREFVSRGMDLGRDPVLPVADKEKLMGMGIFKDGVLVGQMDGNQALLYELLSGQAREVAVLAGDSTFAVTARQQPKIQIDQGSTPPRILVRVKLEAKLMNGSERDIPRLAAQLEGDMTSFLRETLQLSSDVLGIGNVLRKAMLLQEDWESALEQGKLSGFDIFTQTSIKI